LGIHFPNDSDELAEQQYWSEDESLIQVLMQASAACKYKAIAHSLNISRFALM
jgi:hypothetical protein